MNEINGILIDWAENYFKSRDAYEKKIMDIKKNDNILEIQYKDKLLKIISSNNLSDIDIGNFIIITLNNRRNVDYLASNWKKFADFNLLKIYFINPLSTTEKKWIITPFIHDKVCDSSSLRQGLLSMFETVEPLTEEILKAKALKV